MMLLSWLLATAVTIPGSANVNNLPRRIDVNCAFRRGLERALARAQGLPEIEIVLHGVCAGHYVISSDGVTLRGASPGSGLSAPAGDPGQLPVLEVDNVSVSLRELIVRGGVVGAHAHGWDAEILLDHVDIFDQTGTGIFASRGAQARLLDSTVRDGELGILADSDATLNLQRVHVHDLRTGVVVSGKSFAALNDTTIENSRVAGLSASYRSDVNVLGGAFRENGQVHIEAADWSAIVLLESVEIGSETDATPYALGVSRHASIASYTTPVIYGSVGATDGGSIRMGNTTLHGDLLLWEFSDAIVRNARVSGIVACSDGAGAICDHTTTAGAVDCPSPTCGAATAQAAAHAATVRKLPVVPLKSY